MAEIKKIKVGTTEYTITDANAIHGIKSINTTNTASLGTASSESIAGSGTFNLHKVSKTGKFSDLNGRGEEYLEWGGTSHSGSISPIGMTLSSEHSANRVALINPNALTFEYSSDGGTTWTAYSHTGEVKTKFCTTSLSLPIGRPNNSTNLVANKSKTRITITAQDGTHGYVYTSLKKMLVQVSTATTLSLLVETRTGTNYKNNGAWSSIGTYNLSGWSGWNDIPTLFSLGGGSTQTSNNWQMRLTITCTTVSSSYPKMAEVLGIRLFGDNCWTQASNLAGTGNIYTYDMSGNVTFPSEVSATTYYAKNSSGAWKELVLDDDSRLTNSRPASDVYAWAKSSTKPSYTASEVGVTESKFPGIMKTGTVKSVSVKINGAVKGTVTDSGTIDLGTYLTSHQPLTNYVTLNTKQTITGVKTFDAPKSANGEQATVTFKTANGGQIIFGKEGPNSGSMIALDQVAGTRRLNFRASATPGAIVWSQPESNSSLYYDVTNIYFRECTHISFNSASTITFNKFTNASALGTDANGNLKKVSLAKVATSGSYNDLNNKPTILTTSDVNSLIADKFNKCVEITKFAYDGGTPTDPTDSYRTQILNNGSDIIFESAYKPTNDGNYDFDHKPKAYSAIRVMSDRIVLGAEDNHREGLSLVLTPNDITISDGQREFSVLDRSVVTSSVASGNTNVLTSGGAYTALSKKQDNLVSGTNIKTINGNSLLGSGNLSITASLPSTTIVSNTNTTGYFSYDSSDWARWQLKAYDGTKQIKIYLTSIHIRGGNNSLTAVTFRDTWEKVPAVFVQEKISPSMDIGSTYRNGLQVQDITKTGCNIRNNKGEAVYVNVMVIGW